MHSILTDRFNYLLILTAFFIALLSFPSNAFSHPPTCPDVDRDLYLTTPYMHGDDVLELQKRLKQLGFYNGPCDGVYGNLTAKAVANFHKKNNLSPTSRVTAVTWSALAKGCERPVSSQVSTPPHGPVSIIVDTEKRTLTVMDRDRVYRQFPVAVGKPSTPSPVGDWMIIEKDANCGGGFGARWLGLNVPWGIYGIHGTNKPWSIGEAVSAGCIRMYNEDIIQLYEWVSIGTRVKILGPPHWMTRSWMRTLSQGHFGPDVVFVQMSLKKIGFYPYLCDSWYGYLTELGVRSFQAAHCLPVTGRVDEKTYKLLQEKGGIIPLPPPENY
ncbi:MAG: L,D-transpeptidase family protein [Thermacetogeniaceae bacterium]